MQGGGTLHFLEISILILKLSIKGSVPAEGEMTP